MSHLVEEESKQTQTSPMATQGSGYQFKKIGDLLEEINDMLFGKREQLTTKATGKVLGMLDDFKSLYNDLMGMANVSAQNVDPNELKRKQNHLNDLENKAVQGVYGAEAKIWPLDQAGQPVHHVRVQAIPPGQATVRDLIEKCHQMVTRVLDRLEETIASKEESGAGLGTGMGMGLAGQHTQGQQPHIQTHGAGSGSGSGSGSGTGVTLTEEGREKQQPHVSAGAHAAEGATAPGTALGPGAGFSAH